MPARKSRGGLGAALCSNRASTKGPGSSFGDWKLSRLDYSGSEASPSPRNCGRGVDRSSRTTARPRLRAELAGATSCLDKVLEICHLLSNRNRLPDRGVFSKLTSGFTITPYPSTHLTSFFNKELVTSRIMSSSSRSMRRIVPTLPTGRIFLDKGYFYAHKRSR